jgi:alanine transaminase
MQIPYYLDEDNKWGLDIKELQRSLDAARPRCIPRAIVIINPGNPTGNTTLYYLSKYHFTFAFRYHVTD